MKKLAFAAMFALAGTAHAGPSFMPSGPQTNVAISTVLAGGWTQCYLATFDIDIGGQGERVLDACQGDNLMMAGRVTGSDTLLVLAAADRADTIFDTGTGNRTATHIANGSKWYYARDWSWGFTSIDDDVDKYSCDYNNSSPTSMCLHTGGGGYRINDITDLNGSRAYEKIFFISNDLAAVPEPASFALFGLAGAGLIAARRRKRK